MSRLKCLKISLPDAKIWKAIFWQYSKGWRRPRVAAGEDCITKRCAVFFTQCIFHEDGRKKAITRYFCSSVCHALLAFSKSATLYQQLLRSSLKMYFSSSGKVPTSPRIHRRTGRQMCASAFLAMNIYSLKNAAKAMKIRQMTSIKTNVLCKEKNIVPVICKWQWSSRKTSNIAFYSCMKYLSHKVQKGILYRVYQHILKVVTL